jgi:hypothetical protein
MGSPQAPIPAIASAAMLFSFFVAVMLTPWLMLRIGKAHAHGAGHADAGHGGVLGRLYSRGCPADPREPRPGLGFRRKSLVPPSDRSASSTRSVTVKPCRSTTRPTQVVVDLPGGRLDRGHRPRAAAPSPASRTCPR